MVTFIGLDLSLTSTGICFSDQCEALCTNLKGVERLNWLQTEILNRVKTVENPFVCIEGYSFGSRNSQAHAIGELGGVVRHGLWKENIPWVDIPPTCRAKFATGKGNAAKSEVVSSISARTGIVWSGKGADDMCDAWILREMALAYSRNSQFDWPKINLSSLESVDWSSLDTYYSESNNPSSTINLLEQYEQAE